MCNSLIHIDFFVKNGSMKNIYIILFNFHNLYELLIGCFVKIGIIMLANTLC